MNQVREDFARPLHEMKAASTPPVKLTAMVIDHMPLVKIVANRVKRKLPPWVDTDDLLSAGYVGLIEAARRFDPAQDNTFASFVEFRIKGAMLDDIRVNDSLSRDMRKHTNRLRDASARLAKQLNRFPGDDEMAAELGLTVEAYMGLRHKTLAGAHVMGFDDVPAFGGPNFLESYRDANAADPLEDLLRRESTGILVAAIERLPLAMRTVIALHYGQGMKLREVGKVIGRTESRACQIALAAVERLRVILERAEARA